MGSAKMMTFHSLACVPIPAECLAGNSDTVANLGASDAATFCCRSGAPDRDQGGAIARIAGTGPSAAAFERVNRRHGNHASKDRVTFECTAKRVACFGPWANVEYNCEP